MVRHLPGKADEAVRLGAEPPPVPSGGGESFVVKVRDLRTRSWGDQTEVVAASAKSAAETLLGERLLDGPGERSNLRARVWALPFGSQPDIPFYAGPAQAGGGHEDEV